MLAPHLLVGFAIWLCGSALAYLDRARETLLPRLGARFLVAAGIVLACAMTASRLNLIEGPIGMLLVGAAFALFAWTLLRVDPRPIRAAAPLARYGAGASFSLYAIHFPLLALVAAISLGGTRMQPSARGATVLLAVVALAVTWGWLFSRLTEAQTAWLRNLGDRGLRRMARTLGRTGKKA